MRRAFSGLVCSLLLGTNACSSRPSEASSEAATVKSAACLTGPGTTLLFEGNVSALASDGSQLFVAGDAIDSVPLSGGPAVTLAAPSDPSGLSYLKGNLYFSATEPGGSSNSEGKVSSEEVFEALPLAGGSLTAIPGMNVSPVASASDGDALYLAASGQSAIIELTGPSATPTTLPLDGTISIDAICAHGGDIYVAGQDLTSSDSFGNGVIERIPKVGGSAERIVSNIGHPWSLVADDTGLYWQQDPLGFEGNGAIMRANVDGTSLTTLTMVSARSLALANGQLYFTSDAIYSIPTAGGTATLVASSLATPGMLLVIGSNLAWTDPVSKALSDPTVPEVMTACVPD